MAHASWYLCFKQYYDLVYVQSIKVTLAEETCGFLLTR